MRGENMQDLGLLIGAVTGCLGPYDACFLTRNLARSVPENVVVLGNRGDDCGKRCFQYIGGIKRTTEPSFKNKSAGTRENANIAAAVVTKKVTVAIGGFDFFQ